MIINTKSVKSIPITENIAKKIAIQKIAKQYFDILNDELLVSLNNNNWIGINDDIMYYNVDKCIIIPNPEKIILDVSDYAKLPYLKWKPMEEWVVSELFINNADNPIIDSDDGSITYRDSDFRYTAYYIYCNDKKNHMRIIDGIKDNEYISWKYSIKLPFYPLIPFEKDNLLFFLIDNDFNVFEDLREIEIFDFLVKLRKKSILVLNEEVSIKSCDDEEYKFIYDELKKINKEIDIDDSENIKQCIDGECIDDMLLNVIKRELLDCDKKRINMESYPEHILSDPESGHWEIWDTNNSTYKVDISSSLVARNPVFDALDNQNGIVGIDFGTKSTVVTYRRSTADILPMRIGSGQFSRKVSKNDYENPTVIELRDVYSFIEDYKNSEGRPNTCWEDLVISHEAAEQLKSEQSKGDTFASYFSELKQWASDKSRQVRLRDLKGKEIDIPSYVSLSEGDFDPIEVYAYNLGLFINNMIHKIYLRYKLSFPATVEKMVRDKILVSFTRGIKKSLPKQVLDDETCMKRFKVEQGASEPAAYAITALTEYGFDPEDDQKYYYGIFDFGGGTTDFDFGVWSSEEDEPENYDYVISHFGEGGDPYLGGENLLNILAYHVFIKNYDKLLQDKIVFIRPFGEKEIAGKDYLICQDSQYAHFNQKRLMEKLRGVWEGNKDVREGIKSNGASLPLFTMNGEDMSNYNLEVDIAELDKLIEERIEKGVSQFFDALKNCFGVANNQKDLHDVDCIHIFLAGNSSKSPVVYKIFKKYIDMHNEELLKNEEKEDGWFRLYPPLGMAVSDKILSGDMNPDVNEIIDFINENDSEEDEDSCEMDLEPDEYGEEVADDAESTDDVENDDQNNDEEIVDDAILNRPTGKTGVAYGLLNDRVRVLQNETEEISFRYYIGQNRKNKFYCVIDKDQQQYDKWVRFCTASKEKFEIWFTRNAAAPTNKTPINQIGIYYETGDVFEVAKEKAVYIRLVSPTEIEYVVATEDEINDDSFDDNEIYRVSLQEKE